MTKNPSKFDRELEAERTRVRRGVFKPTEQMERDQKAYLKLLEDRKNGKAPLYTHPDGRTYP